MVTKVTRKRTRGGSAEITEKTPAELPGMIKEIGSRYGAHVVSNANEIVQPLRISTGVFLLDFCLLGGIPVSRGTMLLGRKHSGKGQRYSDRILTPTGWKMFGSLSVGDSVIGSDGKPTRVTGIYPRGVLPVYRVTFTDRTSLVVDGDHLWQVQTNKQATSCRGYSSVVSTRELALLEHSISGRGYTYRIPMVAPVEFVSTHLPMDPYLLGVLLANGYLKSAVFTTNDEGVVDTVRARNPRLSVAEHSAGSARRWYVSEYMQDDRSNIVKRQLKELGLYKLLSHDKYIPDVYLRGSVSDRLALLQGLMDCDGSSTSSIPGTRHHKGNAQYCTRSFRLAEGVQELVQSLGGTATIRTLTSHDGVADYNLGIVLPKGVSPYLGCARKVHIHQSRGHRNPVRSIVSVVEEGTADVMCISVAARDGLYVTSDYIVTHNTTLACLIAANAQLMFADQRVVVMDIEGTFDTVWAAKLGVDLSTLLLVQPETGEAACDIVDGLVRTKEVSMVIVDSVAALSPMKEIEGSSEDANVGLQARLMGTLLRKTTAGMIAERHRGHFVTPLYINQYRAKIGGGAGGFAGEPLMVPGGHALGFANSVEIKVTNWEKTRTVRGMDILSHNEHTFKIEKNKLNGGMRSGEFRLIRSYDEKLGLDEGALDDGATLLAFAKTFGAYVGGGSSWTLHFWDEERKFRGVDDAITSLYQDGDLYGKLRNYLIWENAKFCGMSDDFLARFTDPYDL